ncbi:MAG: hypothetical protein MJ155_02680 [Candidatus Saccharibacteria bacterium]|nr:hypothetical protein [Candidatus Saccharibacteria bacterium]
MKKPVDYLWDLFVVMLFVGDTIERDRVMLRNANVQEALFEKELPQIEREFHSILRERHITEEVRKCKIYEHLEQMYPDSRQLAYFYTFDELCKQAQTEGRECGVRFIEPQTRQKSRCFFFERKTEPLPLMMPLEKCPTFI